MQRNAYIELAYRYRLYTTEHKACLYSFSRPSPNESDCCVSHVYLCSTELNEISFKITNLKSKPRDNGLVIAKTLFNRKNKNDEVSKKKKRNKIFDFI